jgi:hypothetical protein
MGAEHRVQLGKRGGDERGQDGVLGPNETCVSLLKLRRDTSPFTPNPRAGEPIPWRSEG